MLFNNTCRDILAIASAMLDGELEYRKGEYDAAFASLEHSIELDDNLPYDEPWGWMQPTRHAYGALLLEQGRVEEAEAVYRADLGLDNTLPRPLQHPGNVWALHGFHECLVQLGKTGKPASSPSNSPWPPHSRTSPSRRHASAASTPRARRTAASPTEEPMGLGDGGFPELVMPSSVAQYRRPSRCRGGDVAEAESTAGTSAVTAAVSKPAAVSPSVPVAATAAASTREPGPSSTLARWTRPSDGPQTPRRPAPAWPAGTYSAARGRTWRCAADAGLRRTMGWWE